MNQLIYATLDTDTAADVILNGVCVYWEDDDKNASNMYLSARTVADQIALALKVKIHHVKLSSKTMPMEEDEGAWQHDDIVRAALAKVDA